MNKLKKEFKIPSFENRCPCLLDRLLFVPQYYHKHNIWKKENGFNYFANDNKIFIEFCSGNGEWIVDKAKNFTNINWIAVEKDLQRARKIWFKIKKLNIENLFVVFGEAYTFVKNYVDNNIFSSVFINFPDPWFKKKHEKHRLVNKAFTKELLRISKKNSKLTIATDHEDLANYIFENTVFHKDWISIFKNPFFKNEIQGYGTSFFEDLFRKQNKNIFYMQFINNKT